MTYAKLIGFTTGLIAAVATVAATRRKTPPDIVRTLNRGGSVDEQPEGEIGVDYVYKPADIGDIVAIGGYEGRTFQIDGYHITTHFLPDEYYMELFYDAIDVESDAWVEADSEDVRLIAPASEAAVYLDETAAGGDEPYTLNEEVTPMYNAPKPPKQPTARELSAKAAAERKAYREKKQALIDRLLDRINDLRELSGVFGQAHGDYPKKIARAEKALRKLTNIK